MEPQKTQKTKKVEKPMYHDFLNHLHVIIAPLDSKKDPTSEAYKHIKRGYQGKIENSHIDDLCKYLFPWEHFPKLAIKIALEVSARRSPPLIEKLFRNIKNEMAVRVQFPKDKIPLFTNVSDSERRNLLQRWIKSNYSDGVLNPDWARNAIICLLGEHITEDDFHAIHAIVEGCFSKRKKIVGQRSEQASDSGKRDGYLSYVKLVAPLFIAGKAAKSKASFGLDMSHIFIERANKLELENFDLKDIHTSLRADLRACRDSVNEKDGALKQIATRNEMLQREIQSKNKSLEEEAERYKLLDKHWQEKIGHELARQAYNFQKYFSFEIREAILSLDTEHPDIAMAINRIRHMEEYLQKMEQADERK